MQKLLPIFAITAVLVGAVVMAILFLSDTGGTTLDVYTPPPEEAEPLQDAPRRSSPARSSGSASSSADTSARETRSAAMRGQRQESAIFGSVMKDLEALPNVGVYLLDGDQPLRVLASTTTGKNGVYRFEALNGSERFVVALIDPSHAIAVSEVVQFEQNELVREVPLAALEPTTLSVVVRDEAAEPLPAANIRLEGQPALDAALRHALTFAIPADERPTKPIELETSENGTFTTVSLAEASYVVSAGKDGYQGPQPSEDGAKRPLRASGDVSTDTSSPTTLNLTLTSTSRPKLRGTVVSATDKTPVSGALVRIWSEFSGEVARAFSDANGEFRIDDVIGDSEVLLFRFVAQAEGFGTATRRGMEDPAKQLIGTIELPPGATLTGIVLNEERQPVADAKVYISTGMMERGMDQIVGMKKPAKIHGTTTGADGRFTLNGLSVSTDEQGDNPDDTSENAQRRRNMRGMLGNTMTMTLIAEAEGYAAGTSDLKPFSAGEVRSIEVMVGQAGRIVGRVVDPAGTGVAGATVAAVPATNPMLGMGFRFTFQGNFEGPAARMMPGAGQMEFNLKTDENGGFVIDSLAPGPYSVGGKAEGRSTVIKDGVVVAGGQDTEVVIELAYTGVIFGTYYGEDGRPTGGANLTMAGMGTMTFRSTETDSSGGYRFEGVGPGSYKVIPSPKNPNDQSQWMRLASSSDGAVVIEGGEEKRFDVYENPVNTTRIYGRVTLNGQPYVNSNLSIAGGGFSAISVNTTRTDENGDYEMKGVALGAYTITLGSLMPGTPGFLQNKRVSVTEKPSQEVNIDMRSFTITGTVTMKSGGPLGNDVVVLATKQSDVERSSGGMRRPFDEFQTSFADQRRVNPEDGSFSIDQLAEGTYIVTARSPLGGIATSNPIRLNRDFGPLRLELDGRVGTLVGIVENYLPPEGGSMMGAAIGDRATLIFLDEEGRQINLGSTSAGGMIGDNFVALEPIESSTNRRFEMKGLPVGTWTVTFQTLNYAPVTRVVKIEADLVATQNIVLSKSGHLELEILNSDLPADASESFEMRIVASNKTEFVKHLTMAEMMQMMFNQGENSGKAIITLKDFPPDTYTMTARLPGFREKSIGFTIVAEQTTKASVHFEKE